jgi:hypothetical protein
MGTTPAYTEMKTAELEACQRSLTCYTSEGNDFLYNNVTGKKSWVHHYDREMTSQSLEYHHLTSPRKKKVKAQPSTENCMLAVF